MSDKSIKVDVDALNAFVKKEAKQARQATDKDATDFAADTGLSKQHFFGVDDLGSVGDTFCDYWPSLKKLLKWASWVPGIGGILSQATIVVKAIDKYIVPQICAADSDQNADGA